MSPPRFIVCDWDGTAVTHRSQAAASHLVAPLERVLELGLHVYVVTGTRHEHVAASLSVLRPDLKDRVVICSNRGSEVYRLADSGPSLLSFREITPDESRAISAVVASLETRLVNAGHDVRIVSNRLNRTKVDLLPEWSDPPKHRIAEVVELADSRYTKQGGLAGVLRLTDEFVASTATDLRVTSDAKHIEVGITDKSDSMAWVLADMAGRGGTVHDLIVVGDEFGAFGGSDGSDAKTAVAGALVYSVGIEPNGVPADVRHIGGGPEGFVTILRGLAQAHMNGEYVDRGPV